MYIERCLKSSPNQSLHEFARTFANGKAGRLAADRRRHKSSSADVTSTCILQQKHFFTMALELFTKKFMQGASSLYKRAVAAELNKMGKLCSRERRREER